MLPISYGRHQFSSCVTQQAIRLYLRFTLSYRDVEELFAAHGLRQCRPWPSPRWHLDEMVVRIAGKRMYLWRAVDDEGEVLDALFQRRRDKVGTRTLMRKLLKKRVLRRP